MMDLRCLKELSLQILTFSVNEPSVLIFRFPEWNPRKRNQRERDRTRRRRRVGVIHRGNKLSTFSTNITSLPLILKNVFDPQKDLQY